MSSSSDGPGEVSQPTPRQPGTKGREKETGRVDLDNHSTVRQREREQSSRPLRTLSVAKSSRVTTVSW